MYGTNRSKQKQEGPLQHVACILLYSEDGLQLVSVVSNIGKIRRCRQLNPVPLACKALNTVKSESTTGMVHEEAISR